MKKYVIIIITILVIGVGVWFVVNSRGEQEVSSSTSDNSVVTSLSIADRAGRELSAGRCTGAEKAQLTHLPMDEADFSMIIPYGYMIGAHVTPIDHQYFSPTDFNSKINTYPVYAMADSRIVGIGLRDRTARDGTKFYDHRIVFTISCRLLYYYDLVTSLAPDVQAELDRDGNAIDYPVKAGQLIGYIGEQTLDFAVWDTDKPLTGFVNPEDYASEGWKQYTADPLEYYPDDIRQIALSKYLRQVEPRSGKIDYDVDGRLIGNWFLEGTNGYGGVAGEGNGHYWSGHLSFAPDYIDPTGFQISIGNWPDENHNQFAAKGNTPDPATVGTDAGLIKYDLVQVNYKTRSSYWDRMTLRDDITFSPGTESLGCALAQLTDVRTLRFQAFKGTPCTAVSGFTDESLTYIR